LTLLSMSRGDAVVFLYFMLSSPNERAESQTTLPASA
jgi:hypothetical protein